MTLFTTVHRLTIDNKHILAALIDSEQMLLSIEAQLCTRKECKMFRPRRPSSVAMHKVRVRHCPTYIVTYRGYGNGIASVSSYS